MTNDYPTPLSSTQVPRPRRGGARPDPFPLLQGLDRLRDFVHQRLDRIEAMTQERGLAVPSDPSEREQELRRRLAEAEERQGRIVAEARRREQEWQTGLDQLESDRQLLTEAWERLERERIDGPGSAHGAQQRGGGPQHRPAAPPPPSPAQVFHPVADTESNDVITHAILQQFQALRSDVRRNANGRRPRR